MCMCLQLVKLRVLIVGMQGIGIECAKNLILAGPGAITLHDGAYILVLSSRSPSCSVLMDVVMSV